MRIPALALLALLGCSSESHSQIAPSSDASVANDSAAPIKDSATTEVVVDALDCIPNKTCVGAPLPSWSAFDFQPKSPGYNTSYGLSAFKGKVIVVALLSAS